MRYGKVARSVSRTIRHVVGAIIGIVISPLAVAAFAYPAYRHGDRFSPLLLGDGRQLVVAAAMVACGIVLGLSAGSRVSPLASLIPGVILTGFGLVWALQPSWVVHRTLRGVPDQFNAAYQAQAASGLLLMLGALLLVASIWPSRWHDSSRTGLHSQPAEPVPASAGDDRDEYSDEPQRYEAGA